MKIKTNHNLHIFIGVILLMLSSVRLKAQEVTRDLNFEAYLSSFIILNVDPMQKIEFELIEVNDSLFQFVNKPERLKFNVEASENWNLYIKALKPYFEGKSNPENHIPLDFLSVRVVSEGTNKDDGTDILNHSKTRPLVLSRSAQLLLECGPANNKGNLNNNSFSLEWEFNSSGGDNPKSLISGGLHEDLYTLEVQLIVVQSLSKAKSDH